MQAKTLLALFCTIVIVFIGVNDGAPTTTKATTVKTNATIAGKTTATVAGKTTATVAGKTTASVPGKTTATVAGKTTASVPGKTTASVSGKTTVPVVAVQPPKLPGSRTKWKTKIDPKSKKLFNDYKKVILKKLQSTHKVAATFDPKPTKVSSQIVSGILYHYLVKLPTKKYAYVTIHDRQWKKEQYGNEEHVTVRPQLYELNDKNI